MVDLGTILKVFTTVATFFEGVVQQIAPIVDRIIDRKTTTPPRALVNPNCQLPICGNPPNYCPEEQLSTVCLQRKMAFENNAHRRLTTLSSTADDDDKKEKSSTSMSPGTTIMLVFVGVIVLAIIGFLYMRCNQQNANTRNYEDRKSSTWSV